MYPLLHSRLPRVRRRGSGDGRCPPPATAAATEAAATVSMCRPAGRRRRHRTPQYRRGWPPWKGGTAARRGGRGAYRRRLESSEWDVCDLWERVGSEWEAGG